MQQIPLAPIFSCNIFPPYFSHILYIHKGMVKTSYQTRTAQNQIYLILFSVLFSFLACCCAAPAIVYMYVLHSVYCPTPYGIAPDQGSNTFLLIY
uniref:Uncharacterized protein n=1 Tax=Anguilla anguilla TaxID=7936 RepID=A0A0E9PE15_ANGAN